MTKGKEGNKMEFFVAKCRFCVYCPADGRYCREADVLLSQLFLPACGGFRRNNEAIQKAREEKKGQKEIKIERVPTSSSSTISLGGNQRKRGSGVGNPSEARPISGQKGIERTSIKGRMTAGRDSNSGQTADWLMAFSRPKEGE